MSDLISRQAAIYHCRKRLYQTAEGNRQIEVYADIAEDRICEWLNEVPSAEPEQRWIPVTERLPEDNGEYLVTFDDGFVSTTGYDADGFELWADSGEVTAWMPLPEPYKNVMQMNDLISRQDAIYHLRKRLYQTAEGNRPIEVYADIAENRICEWLNEVPSAQPERKKGEWIFKDHLWECNQCGCRCNRANPLSGNIWNYYYCPNCGSDMKGEKDG